MMSKPYDIQPKIMPSQHRISGRKLSQAFIEDNHDIVNDFIKGRFTNPTYVSEHDMKHMIDSLLLEMKYVANSDDMPVLTLPELGKFMPSRKRVIMHYVSTVIQYYRRKITPKRYARLITLFRRFFNSYKDYASGSLKHGRRNAATAKNYNEPHIIEAYVRRRLNIVKQRDKAKASIKEVL